MPLGRLALSSQWNWGCAGRRRQSLHSRTLSIAHFISLPVQDTQILVHLTSLNILVWQAVCRADPKHTLLIAQLSCLQVILCSSMQGRSSVPSGQFHHRAGMA